MPQPGRKPTIIKATDDPVLASAVESARIAGVLVATYWRELPSDMPTALRESLAKDFAASITTAMRAGIVMTAGSE